MNPNMPTPRQIIIKMGSNGSKRKTVNYQEVPIRLSADFSTEMLQAKRELQNIFKVLKQKNVQPSILYPASLSFGRRDKELVRREKLKRIQQY